MRLCATRLALAFCGSSIVLGLSQSTTNLNTYDDQNKVPLPSPPAYYWNKEDYPNPQTDPKICHQYHSSMLCDPDDILTKDQKDHLDQLLSQLSNSTRCFCSLCPPGTGGIQVAIALARYIYQDFNSRLLDGQNFADYLHNRWNYGQCNNTVLVLVVTSIPEIATSLGHTAERLLTTTFFSSILESHRASYQRGDFYEGLRTLLVSIRAYTNSIEGSAAFFEEVKGSSKIIGSSINEDSSGGSKTAIIIVGVILGFMFLVTALIFLMIFLKRRYEKEPGRIEQKPSGYWDTFKSQKSQNQPLRPSNPDVYEPCSIEEDEDEVPELLGQEARIGTPELSDRHH